MNVTVQPAGTFADRRDMMKIEGGYRLGRFVRIALCIEVVGRDDSVNE